MRLLSCVAVVEEGGIRDELRRARSSGRVQSAYLLDGPPGTPTRESAIWFARLLLCRADGDDPCGECGDCRRSGARAEEASDPGSHPDLQILQPDGPFILVDAVRALQRELSLVANEGGRRIGVILHADRLRTGAANALLKTLEEPPGDAVLILTAERAEALPRTIRSRTARLRFPPESETEIIEALRTDGLDPEDAWLAAAMRGGSSEAARAWAETTLDAARDLLGALRALASSRAGEVLDFAETFRGGAAVRDRVELFLSVHAALVRREVQAAAERGDAARARLWLHCYESGERARRELVRRNLNPQMLVEGLLLEYRRASA